MSDSPSPTGAAAERRTPRDLARWQRLCAGAIGIALVVFGILAVFNSANQAGTTALIVAAAIALLIAVIGRDPVKIGKDGVEWARAENQGKVIEAVEEVLTDPTVPGDHKAEIAKSLITIDTGNWTSPLWAERILRPIAATETQSIIARLMSELLPDAGVTITPFGFTLGSSSAVIVDNASPQWTAAVSSAPAAQSVFIEVLRRPPTGAVYLSPRRPDPADWGRVVTLLWDSAPDSGTWNDRQGKGRVAVRVRIANPNDLPGPEDLREAGEVIAREWLALNPDYPRPAWSLRS